MRLFRYGHIPTVGNDKTASKNVDQCLRALEELDSLLLHASRNEPNAFVKTMKSNIGIAVNAINRAGFSRWGNERLYDGRTGEMVKSLVFMGPTFYQRLTHMSEDKVKFRNTGPVHPLTRQPVVDRKRFGGIKFGEMERDCLIAHGASANLHERLFTLSDSSEMHVCRRCKRMANVIQRSVPGGQKIRGPFCRVCDSVEDVIKVSVPYGAKLLGQELFSMGISLKFDTELC